MQLMTVLCCEELNLTLSSSESLQYTSSSWMFLNFWKRAIRPWVQHTPRANFVQLHQFHRLFVITIHFGYCLRQSTRLFWSNVCWVNHMSVAEWVDTYGIYHWRILWSSYKKLAWVGFEPTTTEFHSDALTDWAIRPWVQLTLSANFVQLLQFHRLVNVTFHFGYCLRQSPRFCFEQFLQLFAFIFCIIYLFFILFSKQIHTEIYATTITQ